MEQLTPGEWASEQLKRAPAFAIATAIVVGLLVLSSFIEYTSARPKTDSDLISEADIAEEEPPPIEEIEEIKPEERDLDPVDKAPALEENNVSPVDAPIESDIDVDVEFTEDETSDAVVASDPIPMDLTKRMAVIATEGSTGGFRGVLGSRTKGGKRRAARAYGMPKGTDKSIIAALRWLKKAQNKETGGWEAHKWPGGPNNRPSRGTSNGVSGLALLAYLGFGCTDRQPAEFASTVKKAIEYIVNIQRKEGDDGAGSKKGWFGARMYTQGICTMAMAEAYGMTGRKDCKKAAEMGLAYILRKQPPHGAFGYTGPGNDVSVTGFQVQAIKACLNVGIDVPKAAVERTGRFLKTCMCKNYSTPYRINPAAAVQAGSGKVSMTAAALTGRLFMGHKRSAPDCVGQADFLTAGDRHLAQAKQTTGYYPIYYLSLSMFNMGGKYWRSWNNAFNGPMREAQVTAGPEKGSWSGGGSGGRVFATSMACLSLEVYFRYQRVRR